MSNQLDSVDPGMNRFVSMLVRLKLLPASTADISLYITNGQLFDRLLMQIFSVLDSFEYVYICG